MKKENIEFLKELQNELNTQDKLSQADPRFWVIRDYKWLIIPMEYAEENYRVYDSEGTSWTFEQFIKYLEESGDDTYDEILKESNKEPDYDNIETIVEKINKHYDSSEYEIHGVTKEWFNVSDTMFLTKREAENHLKKNHYHYTSEAHTYAMTAWRSPQVEKLIHILQTESFENDTKNEVKT